MMVRRSRRRTATPTGASAHQEPRARLITNTSVQRPNDALKLVDVLLVERKISRNIPVIVFSEQQDPAVIKHLAQAGISDYILLTDDAKAILPRVDKVLASSNIGERLVGEATTYLGPAARVLVEKGTKVHLKMPGLEALRREHFPDLFAWIRWRGKCITDGQGKEGNSKERSNHEVHQTAVVHETSSSSGQRGASKRRPMPLKWNCNFCGYETKPLCTYMHRVDS